MYQRRGPKGDFWGCSKYKSDNCRGTVNIGEEGQQTLPEAARPQAPPPEQPTPVWVPPPTAKCRYCPKLIVWVIVTKDDGTKAKIPVDPTVAVYLVSYVKEGEEATATRCKPAMVNHWATCTGAAQAKADYEKKQQKKS